MNDQREIGAIRQRIVQRGLGGFVAAPVRIADLALMRWAGDALHLDIMRAQLSDAQTHADTLAIYAPAGIPVSKGYVTHDPGAGVSTIAQLATHPQLQSLGLGSLLLAALEERIRARGIARSVLGVEQSNPRARKLYESVGYVHFETASDRWQAVDGDGREFTHSTMVDWLAKTVRADSG